MSEQQPPPTGIFADLAAGELARIAEQGTRRLGAGEVLFREGDSADDAFVIRSGEVEILRRVGGADAVLAVRGPAEVIGEMALLADDARSATARARTEVEVLVVPKSAFDALASSSPDVARALLGVFVARWQETEEHLRRVDRLARLGTLTAGLAHELNNPAAAVVVAAGELRRRVADLAEARVAVDELGGGLGGLERLLADAATRPPLGSLDRADRADEVEGVLSRLGVGEGWKVSSVLVDAGLTVDDLDEVVRVAGAHTVAAVGWLVATADLDGLLRQVEEGTRRMSDIVRALKGHVHLDRAPVGEVDVVDGIEDTLLLLGGSLEGIRVERDYHPDRPRVEGVVADLNQVWMNLLDNAAAAIRSVGGGGTIEVTVRGGEGGLVVEVADDGPGIPEDECHRVFDAFFTTKPQGEGTGLGLSTSLAVVRAHRGTIDVDSTPGRTVFRVALPAQG